MSKESRDEFPTTAIISSEGLSTRDPMSQRDEHFLSNTCDDRIDVARVRYPHCLVWTPIPVLTWLFPFIGHMGIARTDGVIRDFAGPYYVSVRTHRHTHT